MGAAAAAAAATAKRKRLERQAAADSSLLDEWFKTFDVSHTGAFERSEMKVVLTQIKREALSDPTAEVTDKLLDKIMQKYGTTNVLRSETGVERATVLVAVKKYKAWLKYERNLAALFEKADRDQSGKLSRDQLLYLLKNVAIERGLSVVVKGEDLDFVIERCDLVGDGEISLEEAGPAVALWTQIQADSPPASIFNCCAGGKKKSASVKPADPK